MSTITIAELVQIGWCKCYDIKKNYAGKTRVYQSEGVARRWANGGEVIPVYAKAADLK